MDGLYTLVVVVPAASELLIESGELGVVFLRFLITVSYTHLDVYKRQYHDNPIVLEIYTPSLVQLVGKIYLIRM